MKYIFALIIIFSICINASAQTKATIGMTLDEVKKIYPNLNELAYENTITLTRPDNLYGLDDSWGYRFEDGKLTWIFFHNYIDELNDSNFAKCLFATRQLIKDYTSYYGNPDTTITGDTVFIDPYVNRHWGYDVLEAKWKDYKGMKIKVEFNFFGGKGEYHFIVSIHYFDKNYPYYE